MGGLYSKFLLTAKHLKITPSQYVKLRHIMLVTNVDARVALQIVGQFNHVDVDR